MQCLTCGMMNIDPLSHTHTKEQPMRDMLIEPEDQTGEHQVTKSGTCVIPGCPCRGWSAQEAAGVKEVAEYHPPTLIDAAKGIEQWWLERGMHAFNGAPAAMFDLRAAIADYDEHQPAARGGGDEWRVFNFTRDGANEWMVTTATGRTVALSNVNDPKLAESEMRQIANEHNQHQALVAERERWKRDRKFLGDRLEAQAETMAKVVKERNQYRLALEIIRDSFWTENEPLQERVDYLQQTAKDILETVQKGPSE